MITKLHIRTKTKSEKLYRRGGTRRDAKRLWRDSKSTLLARGKSRRSRYTAGACFGTHP